MHSAVQLFRKLVCWRNAFANIPCWILHAPVDVRSVFGLSVMHPALGLCGTCSFVVCHSFGDIWLVELKPFIIYSLLVRFNRSMSGACTSLVLVFLPDWPFCHRKTNPVKCDMQHVPVIRVEVHQSLRIGVEYCISIHNMICLLL